MASVQDICNIALSHLGSDAIVSSISPPDGSVEAGHCARFYPIARQAMIEMAQPSFARTRVALAEVTNDSDVWGYAYAKPTACLKLLRILTPGQGATVFTMGEIEIVDDESSSAAFEMEGDVIYTNEAEAVLVYLRDVTDTSKFTPMIVTGMGYLLASFLAGPIIKGEAGASTGEKYLKLAQYWLDKAAASNANSSNRTEGSRPTSIINAR